jgi:hypothetical protein
MTLWSDLAWDLMNPNTTTPHTKHSKTYAMILVTISTIPSWSTNYAT